jgi:hypothetical protein
LEETVMKVEESNATQVREDALAAVARSATSSCEDGDIDGLLHMIAEHMCVMFGVRRCSVYLPDTEAGRFRGRVAHVGRDVDSAIQRLVVGTEADRFTREILSRRQPVLISDARHDPRPVRGTMRAWNICSMLGVPMLVNGEVVGLLYLDDEDERVNMTADELRLASLAADIAGAAIVRAQQAASLRVRLQVESHKANVLQKASRLHSRLVRLITAGAPHDEIATAIAVVVKRPVALYDAGGRLVTCGVPGGADRDAVPVDLTHPDVRAALSSLGDTAGVAGPFPAAGIGHRLLVSPLSGGDTGHVVLVEGRGRFGMADAVMGRCAADVAALMLHLADCASDVDSREERALARDLLLGRDDPAGLLSRAQPHGLGVDGQAHVVCLLAQRFPVDMPGALSADDVREAFPLPYRRAGLLTASVDRGIAVFVPLSGEDRRLAIDDAKRTVREVVATLCPSGAIVGALSRPCRRIEDFVRARGECDQVMQCFASFVDDPGVKVIAADDLGPARLILATGSPAVVTRFAADALGPLAQPSSAELELLRTLACYLESDRLVRTAGLALGVHENTVRYRLSKIAKLTGLDVLNNADDELTAQIAVTVMRIQGRIPGPAETLSEAA